MKKIEKSHKLDNVAYDVRGPVLDQAKKMEKNNMDIIKLNIGNPAAFDFYAPDEVVKDMSLHLKDSEGYSDSKGLFSARKAIMQYCQLKGFEDIDIEDIYTGNGVSELISLSLQALLNDEDEVLVPSPDYPLWTACVSLAGGKAVHYVCDEEQDWYPDLDDMRSKISEKTKALVIINPNNPTGAVYEKDLLLEIAEIARQNDLIIFSDEIYDRIIFDGIKHYSIAALAPDLFTITLNGISKSHRVAGYRAGWMVVSGDKKRARDYIEGLNMMASMRLCSNVPAQSIIQTCLGGTQTNDEFCQPGGRYYEHREYIYKAINDLPGLSAVKPKAAFYIFPKLDMEKFNIYDDEKFALDLLREKQVLIVQGTGFNFIKPDHFRIVYLANNQVLHEAMERIGDFLTTYRQA